MHQALSSTPAAMQPQALCPELFLQLSQHWALCLEHFLLLSLLGRRQAGA